MAYTDIQPNSLPWQEHLRLLLRKPSRNGGKNGDYKNFNPYTKIGDYLVINDRPCREVMEEAMGIIKEQIMCRIPYDFVDFITLTYIQATPSPSDPLAQRDRIAWKYTPPGGDILHSILMKAKRRARNV